MVLSRRALIGGALALSVAAPVHAARLTSVKVTESARLPLIRPKWPVPNEPHQLFFIQRSTNSNTVVYTARFDRDGRLNAKTPAQVYWRRYNTSGERMALRGFERRFAYGMRIRPQDTPGEWVVNAVAAPMFPMLLRQAAPYRAEVFTTIGGRKVHPVYGFVSVDESGFLPRVTAFSFHGIDPNSGRAVSELFSVSDGEFRQ
ncbi:MAG: DUF4833 domain-containing protein [Rhodobacter sp.]|nr:DUF4833 domain-containing protein [Rhodobacter sp.]